MMQLLPQTALSAATQGHNLPIGRGIVLASVCSALSYRLDFQPQRRRLNWQSSWL